ncbi:MAG: LPS export ABC transporter periplasmic protein LptC, partial [Parasphingopyxis sp.]
MSEAALRQRSRRQAWAAPGSRHDRIVKALQIILPSAVGVLAAFLAMAPLRQTNELNFLLAKDNVEVASERMRVERARYGGADAEGRPFLLTAAEAVQQSSDVPIVEMSDIAARMELDDGPAYFTAERGHYDMEDEHVTIDGPVELRASDGYQLNTSDVRIDMPERTMRSTGEVTGRMPLGSFRADRMRVDLADRTVNLEGR